MARAIQTDPFHVFRFGPRVGFDGKIYSATLVDINPGQPWAGPGTVVLEAALWPDTDIIEFAKIGRSIPLVVGVYHITDDFGGSPSLSIVLSGVVPAEAAMCITPLCATDDGILKIRLKMGYERLAFVFGDNPLDKIASVT